MAQRDGAESNAVERRIGFIGLVVARKTSPNTWRWWQRQPWVEPHGKVRITNISLPPILWGYLGNYQEKVTPSHGSWRWDDPDCMAPNDHESNIAALRQAVFLYELGHSGVERKQLAAIIARQKEMRADHARHIVARLRRAAPA